MEAGNGLRNKIKRIELNHFSVEKMPFNIQKEINQQIVGR
jgi:hypothetical protein